MEAGGNSEHQQTRLDALLALLKRNASGMKQATLYAIMALFLVNIPSDSPPTKRKVVESSPAEKADGVPPAQKSDSPKKAEEDKKEESPIIPPTVEEWLNNIAAVANKMEQNPMKPQSLSDKYSDALQKALQENAQYSYVPAAGNTLGRIVGPTTGAGKEIDEWEIGMFLWKKGEGDDEMLSREALGLRLTTDPLCCTIIRGKEMWNADGTMNIQRMISAMILAKKNRESEKKDEADMRNFDLPRNRPIGCIAFYDGTDTHLKLTKPALEGWQNLMSKRYKLIYPEEGGVIDLAQSDEIEKQKKTRPWGEPYLRQPWDVLSLEIKKLYNKGIRDFLIKINAHGDAEGFTFGKLSFPALRMFMLMHSDFPNCRFTLEMMSCYGGGMENYFSKIGDDKDAEPGRITMILQTKPDTINLSNVSRYGNGDQERTYVISAYDAAKARGLILGKPSDPYGQLHLNADEFAKLQQYTDAEAWRMQRFGEGPKRTASLGTGDSHGSLAVKSSRREDLLPRRIKHYQPPAKSYTDRRTLSRHTKRRRR